MALELIGNIKLPQSKQVNSSAFTASLCFKSHSWKLFKLKLSGKMFLNKD